MGTDIHPVVQRRDNDASPWEFVDIPKNNDYGNILDNRNYNVFAILANVRNGYGFAGVVTGSGFKPISDNRGLPEDFPPLIDECYARITPVDDNASSDSTAIAISDEDYDDFYYKDPNYVYFGDHSHTWVTLRELLEYDWDDLNVQAGVIVEAQYREWMKTEDYFHKMPPSYAGAISGPNMVTVTETEYVSALRAGTLNPQIRYVVSFARSMAIRDTVPQLVGRIIPWLESLGDPDNVRIVMGFD
jgi:hypothetical protein